MLWRKAAGASGSCAWGSFQSAANPVLRDTTERVVIASKGRFDRALSRKSGRSGGCRTTTRSPKKSSWRRPWTSGISTPKAQSVWGTLRPFPVALPKRLIELYTYQDDVVLDPFFGAGSTGVAAVETGRNYLGFELEAQYITLAQRRLDAAAQGAPSRN